MNTLFKFFIPLFCIVFLSCSKEETTAPTPGPPPPKKISTRGYGAVLDSSYYKIWSDSSWEKFNRFVTINKTLYATTVDNNRDEYYFSEKGYAGVKPYNEPLLLFDSIPAPLPETLIVKETYRRRTTYTYKGNNYTIVTDQILLDTTTVTVGFGTFSTCLWFKTINKVSVNGYLQESDSRTWLAKGPASIQYESHFEVRFKMVRGRVNYQGWGMPYPKSSANTPIESESNIHKTIVKPIMNGTCLERGVGSFLPTPTNSKHISVRSKDLTVH